METAGPSFRANTSRRPLTLDLILADMFTLGPRSKARIGKDISDHRRACCVCERGKVRELFSRDVVFYLGVCPCELRKENIQTGNACQDPCHVKPLESDYG